jgi:hydrogenase-4 component E
MDIALDMLLVGLLLSDLLLLASSRLIHCVKTMAFQGALVGLIPLVAAFMDEGGLSMPLAIASINVAVKGLALPWLLARAARQANVRKEVEPYVGYPASIVFGCALAAFSFLICSKLSLPDEPLSFLAAPVAFTMMGIGLFIIASRRKALTQVVGFLAFENGICVFGGGLLIEQGLIVELGILLDVLVLVFVMGIAVFQINREFDHADADRLNKLDDDVHEDAEGRRA